MKLKQLAATILLCLLGLSFAYGLSLLTPPKAPTFEVGNVDELDANIYAQVENEFDLPPGNAVYVRQHEGDYYLLGIYPNASEGGGFWAIVYAIPNHFQVVDAGNKYEYEVTCSTLDDHDVPLSIAPQCDNGELYINRADGSALEDQVYSEPES